MLKKSLFIVLTLSLAFATACSKNGGDNMLALLLGASNTSGISSVAPARNATGIAVTTTVQVRFKKDMDSGTVTDTSFTLVDESGDPVIGDVTYADRTATFTPSSSLANLVTYTATLTTNIMDQNGKPLPAAYSWSFTTVSLGQTPAPEFTPPAGTYDSPQTVALSCADASADIYYTTNGDMPDPYTSDKYTGTPVTVDHNMTIRAVAVSEGYDTSEVAEGAFLIQAPKPSFDQPEGEYDHDIDVALSVTGGAAIYYTTGTGEPDTLYTGTAIPVHGDGSSVTIRARSVKADMEDSDIVEVTYSLNWGSAAAPTFNPDGGTFTGTKTVTLDSTTSDATIRYTTDDFTTTHDVAAGGTVDLDANTTLKAYTIKTGMKNSGTTSRDFYIRVAAPEASEAEGTHDHNLAVHLTAATGATIYYTLGSGDPDTPYDDASPIKIEGDNATATIRAKAVKAGMTESGVVSFSYTVEWSTAETPVFDPTGCSFSDTRSLTITSTAGSIIRYTTDKSDPKTATCPSATCVESSSPASVNLSATTTIRAFAYKTMMRDSEEAQATYILAPTLTGITPDTGMNTSTVSVTLTGANFMTGADVRLKKGTESDIVATNVVVVSATEITADLDIDGAVRGSWDVRVTNTDTGFATLAGGFTITDSSNAYLSSLAVSAGTLSPLFAGKTYYYYDRVPSGTTSVYVTPTAAGQNAAITVNGSTVASGSASSPVSLATGNAKFTIMVTSEDSSAQNTYVVFVLTCPRFAFTPNGGDDTLSVYTVDATTGQMRHNGYASITPGTGSYRPSSVAVDPKNRFVYTANYYSNSVSVFALNQTTGVLTAGTAVSTGSSPYSVTVDPTGRFVFTVNYGGNSLSVFSINQDTGALASVETETGGLSAPISATVDPTGRFVYVANYSGNSISVFSIDQDTGALTLVETESAGTSPWSVAVDPSGRFVYAANYNSKNVSVYTIDQTTGALTPGTAVDAGTTPWAVTVDPAGRFAYVVNYSSNNINIYTIHQTTGALTELETGSPVATGTSPSGIAVDPSGMFAYVTSNAGNTVSVYTINQDTGALTAASTISSRSSPYGIAMSSGTSAITYTPKFAYTANYLSANVSVYSINSGTGALTAGTTAITGNGPYSVAADPRGRFLFTMDSSDDAVSAFVINSGTGTLTARTPAAAGDMPMHGVVDPSGRFLYVANFLSANVSVFSINQSTGALTAVDTTTAGANPQSVAIDPSGSFLYVANYTACTISVYGINPGTGKLTARTALSLPANFNPSSVAVEGSGRYLYAVTSVSSMIIPCTIDLSLGTLTVGTTLSTGTGPQYVAPDPLGRFVYAANLNPGSVSAYRINQSSGALTSKTGASSAVYLFGATVDPSGKFLYITSYSTDNKVYPYSIDQGAGTLTAGSSVAAGSRPLCVVTTGVIQ